MKRHSAILLCALLTGGAAMAQHVQRAHAPKNRPMHVRSAAPALGGQREVIWSDDFSDPGNWQLGTLGSATGNWVIGTDGPSGSFAIPAIESTTAANGFALYDSDLLCLNIDSAYIQNATPIDLSAYPGVVLQFEQLYRNYRGHTFVQVSNDNSTWTTYQVNALLASNDMTANPDVITLPITNVAGGQATVWIRFVYGGACDYAWMVDDVAIITQPDNDMVLTVAQTTMWDYVNTTTYDSVPYTVFPVSELRPLGLNMTVTNNGFLEAENVMAHITTSDGYNETGDLGNIASNTGETFQYVAPAYTPTATIGDHQIYYQVMSDATDDVPADNADTLTIGVSEFTYARDAGSLDGSYNDTDEGDGFKLGSVFHVINDETLYAIDVAFPSSSATGVELNAQLTDVDADFTPFAETAERTLMPEDLNTAGGSHYISFIFDEPVELAAGSDYAIFVRHFGGPDVRVGTSGISPAQTSFIYSESQGDWFYVTSTPMVRMNFSPTVGISENDVRNGVGLGQSFPNPAKGSAFIDYSLVNGSMVSLELHDLNGKLVRTLVNGNMAQGVHRVTVSTNDLPEGMYTYTLTAGATRTTKRMTVVH